MQKLIELLIIEDSEDDTLLLINRLRKAGYAPNFKRIDSATLLHQSLAQHDWDLVITDHAMPGFSSIEALEIINRSELSIPVIVVSGEIGEEEAAGLMRAGATDYVLKNNLTRLIPVIERELQESIDRKNWFETQKKAEIRLEILSKAIDQSRSIVFISDASGIIEYTNQGFTEITGWDFEDINKQTPDFLAHPVDTPVSTHPLTNDGDIHHSWHEQQMKVVFSNKTWRGEILNRKKNGEPFWTLVSISPIFNEDGEITNLVNVGEDHTELKTKEKKLQQMAFYDPVTELPNRRLLDERLEQTLKLSKRSGKYAALLCLDLDGFKQINDTFGHGDGDQLLKTVAQRIQQCVRQIDTVARTGGDEFYVLLTELDQEADAKLVAQKIVSEVSKPSKLSGKTVRVTTSVGIATIPGDGHTAAKIKKRSDRALYHAKDCGRNNYKFYNTKLNTLTPDTFDLCSEIKQAFLRNELLLQYLPQVRIGESESKLADHNYSGFEVQLQWQHQKYGQLLASDFLSSCRSDELFSLVNDWTLRQVCTQAKTLQELGLQPVKFFIKLQLSDLKNPKLISTIRSILRETNISTHWIEIGIDESTFIKDMQQSKDTVKKLKGLGITVSIDNFNSKYLSTEALSNLYVDNLRMDDDFLFHLEDKAPVISAIISMAHELDLKVVAKGIENEKQMHFVEQKHCDFAQGHFVSPPLKRSELVN